MAWPKEAEEQELQARRIKWLQDAVAAMDEVKELVRRRVAIDDRAREGRTSDLTQQLERELRDKEYLVILHASMVARGEAR